jgi:hypothetical protein
LEAEKVTMKIPEKNFGDKLLALMGKERAIWIPKDIYKTFGQYAYVQAKKESFWKALFRPKNQDPPVDWFYPIK